MQKPQGIAVYNTVCGSAPSRNKIDSVVAYNFAISKNICKNEMELEITAFIGNWQEQTARVFHARA